jgi:pimeloyl-ACP methyl ester carboxylesterase
MANSLVNTAKNALLAASLAGTAAGVRIAPASAQTVTSAATKPTIVLVHGAFADSSSWNGEVTQLQKAGYTVIAPPNPLRGIASDGSSVAALLKSIKGPIVLVGHSYGGPVIDTAAFGNSQVKALVFVSAYALAQGESVAGLGARYPTSQLTASVLTKVPFATPRGEDVDLYVDQPGFETVFASGLPESQSIVMQATQRPLAASALSEKAPPPAWKSIPSWAVLSERDLVIPPAEQQFMYERAKSKITRVEAGHTALISHPDVVVNVIEEAATSVR